MSTDTKPRPQWVFDGCGINGPDEYRSRLATLTPAGQDAKCGPLMAAAPDLLDALEHLMRIYENEGLNIDGERFKQAKRAVAKAKGEQ